MSIKHQTIHNYPIFSQEQATLDIKLTGLAAYLKENVKMPAGSSDITFLMLSLLYKGHPLLLAVVAFKQV